MSNETEQQQLWTEEHMIAESEAIAAYWRKSIGSENVFDLSRQILCFARSVKDSDRAALHERIAALTAENERLRLSADPEALVVAYGKGYGDAKEKARAQVKALTAELEAARKTNEPGVAIPVEAIKRVMSACAATVDHHHPGVRDEIIQALRDVEAMLDEMEPPNVD